ncbi:MAG: glycoside hydrolase family 15 protein, partial [Chloroflexota bacterium]|nr:glycoside hydrolase family 15 protein [Chloroflexota bacterium]
MPRDLPVGNGELLITFDRLYQLRDVYYPYVGMEDHTEGDPCRFGVWVDGAFHWSSDDVWRRTLRYAADTLVTEVRLESATLGLIVDCRDVVDFDRDVYLKEVTATDTSGRAREVRLFQHFNAHLYGNDVGDSAYYDPRSKGLVHYKARRYFLLDGSGPSGPGGLASYAVGRKETGTAVGTWRDAEDGVLSRNPVAQGSIDTVGELDLRLAPHGGATATFWIAAGQTYDDVRILDQLVKDRGPASFVERTEAYWRLWANKNGGDVARVLPPDLYGPYKRSCLIVRTQTDERGAIVAANDSDVLRFNRDTYSYMWPRDGALAARAMDLAGYVEIPRRFYALCGELRTREGYLQHKYDPDGSVGSSWLAWTTPDGKLQLPIQEDETGLPLWALWLHYRRLGDLEFIKPLYRKLVRAAADFMVSYREPRTKLPAPSIDLWEERRGIHAFTTAAVWAGITAAAEFARAFAQDELAARYARAADEIKAAALEHLWDAERGRFLRRIDVLPDGTIAKDPTCDISLAGVWLFGMLPPDDERVVATMRAIEDGLAVRTAIGGIARYENDRYMRDDAVRPDVAGNPWFVGTLWVAEHHVACAKTAADLEPARAILEWCVARALPSGVMAEQLHPYTGEPLSVSPLTWSHATFVEAAQMYARKATELRAA